MTFLNQLSAPSRLIVQNCLLTAFVLNYLTDENVPKSSSKFGGSAAIAHDLIPVDRSGNRMSLLSQINFADLQKSGDGNPAHSGKPSTPSCPAGGVLMLFLSAEYKSFKPKDSSWYKLIYLNESELSQPSQAGLWAECALSAHTIQFLPESRQEALLATLDGEDAVATRGWIAQEKNMWSERTRDAQLLSFSTEPHCPESRRAEVIAAFHANGITFDEQRATDPHYKHLVDSAGDWIAFWRISGLAARSEEKRDLYVCVRREDLIKPEFLKGALVFL